jgi:hypothetical protein
MIALQSSRLSNLGLSLSTLIEVKDGQPENIGCSIITSSRGIKTCVRYSQFENACVPMSMVLLLNLRLCKEEEQKA